MDKQRLVLLALGAVLCAARSGLAQVEHYELLEKAKQHRQANYQPHEWGSIFYLQSLALPNKRTVIEKACAFVVASTSYQEVMEYSVPQRLPTGEVDDVFGFPYYVEGLHVIDLRLLKWDWKQWLHIITKEYPYKQSFQAKDQYPLVIRADWLLQQLSDTTRSDAHYRLLYNNEKLTRDDFVKFWKGNTDVFTHYGIAEGQSGVSVQEKRWALNQGNSIRTYLWGTFDYLKIDPFNDPFSNPTYPIIERFQKALHDGEEWIAGNPKVSLKTGEFCALQAYLLANNAGKRVEEAPGTLVKTDGLCRRYGAITNFAGCVGCHRKGLREFTDNEYIGLRKPNEATGDYTIAKIKDFKSKLIVDKFVSRNAAFDIAQANALYGRGTFLCNGLYASDNAANFYDALDSYDRQVGLEQAAHEIGVTRQELYLAMGWHSANVKYDALSRDARFADLGKGKTIPRQSFEAIYTPLCEVYAKWRLDIKAGKVDK